MAFPWTSNLNLARPSALKEVGTGRGAGVFEFSSPLLRTIWGRTRAVRASRGVSLADGGMIVLGYSSGVIIVIQSTSNIKMIIVTGQVPATSLFLTQCFSKNLRMNEPLSDYVLKDGAGLRKTRFGEFQ